MHNNRLLIKQGEQMNEKQELLEYLAIVEMKLVALQRDLRNIRGKLEDCEVTRKKEQKEINFFTACKAEDDANDTGCKHGL